MMRALFSGVAGLKTHQTRMDVIGNNIANVNTVGFKSSSVNFADTFYQTTSGSTGANADMGAAGTNAKQIGLGSQVAAIQVNITEQGGPSTTNRALDIAINGASFLMVSKNGETLFTKSGAMNVDEVGNLYCTTNGASIMGWDAEKDGTIVKNTAKPLKVMSADKMYYEPEATEAVVMTGNVDPNDPDVSVEYDATTKAPIKGGEVMTFAFYDNIGQLYTTKLRITKDPNSTNGAEYDVRIEDILDPNGNSIFVVWDTTATPPVYKNSTAIVMFGGQQIDATKATINKLTGELENLNLTSTQIAKLTFNNNDGTFSDVKVGSDRTNQEFKGKAISFSITGPIPVSSDGKMVEPPSGAPTGASTTFPQWDSTKDAGGLNIYFDTLTQYSQGGTSKLAYAKGDHDSNKGGNSAGSMTGISVDKEGKLWGAYNNGQKKCLGQIAVCTFANPSGLESEGDSLFRASLNSGDVNSVGEEILLTGSFTIGALEMSNVDLANEFTTMIITQRGFQANSRTITTTDSMLEELVNLKR